MPQSAKLRLGRVLILLTIKLTFQDDYCSSKIKITIVLSVSFVKNITCASWSRTCLRKLQSRLSAVTHGRERWSELGLYRLVPLGALETETAKVFEWGGFSCIMCDDAPSD